MMQIIITQRHFSLSSLEGGVRLGRGEKREREADFSTQKSINIYILVLSIINSLF